MYLSAERVAAALKRLSRVHPFYGITFLACKAGRLPVGEPAEFPINKKEEELLDRYYRPARQSAYYYRVFRAGPGDKRWLNPDYPSSGSQKTRTTTFREAFVHDLGTDSWAWAPGYVKVLTAHLGQGQAKPIPALDLAGWLYRERDWGTETTAGDIVAAFLDEFHITPAETAAIFALPDAPEKAVHLQDSPVGWRDLRSITGRPPDAPPDPNGILASLALTRVGPTKEELTWEPGARLTLLAGDNGLGKTFLLDAALWALTSQWPRYPAHAREEASRGEAKIRFALSGDSGEVEGCESTYDQKTHSWPHPLWKRPTVAGLVIYCRADGSYAIWDPASHFWPFWPSDGGGREEPPHGASALLFTKDEVENGLRWLGDTYLCEGLIRDWVTWQLDPSNHPFGVFKQLLDRLSPSAPSDIGPLRVDKPMRLPGPDVRLIPTLRHPYGRVPIVHASAGIRRIVDMAYLIAWAWNEHRALSSMIGRPPQTAIVVMVDDIEAHLHPKWQRGILPALLQIGRDLDPDAPPMVQLMVATHSALVLASAEPVFNADTDKLFHLDLQHGEVVLEELPFVRYGEVCGWYTSDVIGLPYARSIEAGQAIDDAKALQAADSADPASVEEVSKRLLGLLAADDPFWPRWLYFAEKRGVSL